MQSSHVLLLSALIIGIFVLYLRFPSPKQSSSSGGSRAEDSGVGDRLIVVEGFEMEEEGPSKQHNSFVCPGSAAWMHAKCTNSFKIADFQCHDVKEEVERRMQGKDDWIDRKSHPGKYVLVSTSKNSTSGTRTTGDGKYTDKFTLSYVDVPGSGCVVNGCSESQVPSAYDYCTNYCNMFNLLCGSDAGCKVSRHDMKKILDEPSWCFFRDRSMCDR